MVIRFCLAWKVISLPGVGVMMISSFGSFNLTASWKVSSMVFPLKFFSLLSGVERRSLGGSLSCGPPLGVVCRAQAQRTRKAITHDHCRIIWQRYRAGWNGSWLSALFGWTGIRELL